MSANTKTDGNLQTAFAGENRANRRYLSFAVKADREGYPQIARLFRAAAASENVHARRHLDALGRAGSDKDNTLSAAAINEAAATKDKLTAKVAAENNAIDEAGPTKNNLTAAMAGERREFTEMYPSFTKDAEKDDNLRAQISFNRAKSVEQIHHKLFEAALKALEANQPLKAEDYYVCGVCGYTVAGEAPEKCPICGALRVLFSKVE